MSTDAAAQPLPQPPASARLSRLIGLPILRVVLVGVAAVATWLVLLAAGDDSSFPPMMLYAATSMLVVNVISLVVPAVIFASQHVFYAATQGAVSIYVVAFLVWGGGRAASCRSSSRTSWSTS